MWKVVVFPDNEVSAVPLSWLIEIEGKMMCFWPKKNANLKRARDDNPPTSGSDNYDIHECRILMNDETFTTFKVALANEIRAQDVSHFDGNENDSSSSSKKDKSSEEDNEFEFVKGKTEINIIDEIKINEPLPTIASSKSENDSKTIQSSSLVLNKDVGDEANNAILLLESQSKAVEKDTVDKHEEKIDRSDVSLFVANRGNDFNTLDEVEVFESSSTSEKLKAIFLNQIAEKHVYTELANRLADVEKHIKKYGGGAYSKAVEELPLQVSSVEMFSQLEKELVDATSTALAEYFNKTIYEKEVKKFVKILLNRFFDDKFFAHNVTSKSGGKVVLNKTRTLNCIYDSIEKKFKKTKDEVEDTVFKAIDQLKDSLRKKFPKLPAEKKRKIKNSQTEKLAEVEDQGKRAKATVESPQDEKN